MNADQSQMSLLGLVSDMATTMHQQKDDIIDKNKGFRCSSFRQVDLLINVSLSFNSIKYIIIHVLNKTGDVTDSN